MMRSFTAFLFCFFLSFSSFAQSRSTISGQLKDPENSPLAFVNLVIRHIPDSAVVKLAVSKTDGGFEFVGIAAGEYFIEASMVGFRRFRSPDFSADGATNKNAGSFTMTPTDVKLKEVNILATKPFISVEPDKLVVKVDNNPLMINSNALEVLRKSPGVVVNQDDQIFLQGKSGLLIYIDGRQSPLSDKDLAAWLRSIPSSQIESVEIITNPSAKYDATGNAGILNIRLKKNQKRGLNGSISSGASMGLFNEHNYFKNNHSLALNYGKKTYNVYANYGFDYNKSWSFMDIYRKQSEQMYDQQSDTYDRNEVHNVKTGIDWNLSKTQTLSFMADGNFSQNRSDLVSTNFISRNGSGQPYSLLEAQNNGRKNNQTVNFNINHQYKDTLGQEVTTDLNYGIYNLASKTNQPNFYRNFQPDSSVVDRSFGLETPVDISILTFKTDVEKKFKSSTLSFGYKISNVETDNSFRLFNRENGQNTKDLSQSSDFTYLERVIAGYVSFRQTIRSKWTAQAGLRYEQTHSKGHLKYQDQRKDSIVPRDYGNLFPSAGLTFNPSKNHALSLNYSLRVDRPVYRFLNPFEYKIDELSYEKGNPFLKPQFTNNLQVAYTFMSMATASLGYSQTSDFFARVIDSSGARSFLTRRNLANVQTWSFNLSSPIPIRRWWNGYVNLGLNHQTYEADFGQGKKLSLPVDYYNVYMQHSFSLPKKISVQVSGSYNSPSVWGGTFRNRAFWFAEAGVNKKVLKGKGTVSLTITDLFLSQRWKGRSDFGGIDITVAGGRDSRTVKAGFSWNFGESDFKPSRRKTGNAEERQRLRGE